MPEDNLELQPQIKGSITSVVVILVIGAAFLLYGIIQGNVAMSLFGIGGATFLIVSNMLYFKRTTYTITKDKIIYDKEILGHKHQEIPVNRIQNTSLRQSALQQWMGGYGTIQISTAGSSGNDLRLWSIENADEVHSKISELTNAYSTDDSSSTDSEDSTEEVLDALEEAKKLRETSEKFKQIVHKRATQGDNNE